MRVPIGADRTEAPGVELTVVVRRRCASPAEAEALRRAVQVDTPDFVRIATRGAELEIALSATSAASARATLEDLFACLKAAERAVVGAPRGSSPPA